MVINLENKIALVTGGAKGIGKAISIKLAEAKANVIINYRSSKEEAENVAKYIEENYGVKAWTFSADVSDLEQVKKMKEFSESFGKISILINNAGITNDKILKNMSPDIWDYVIKANLYSVYNTCYSFLDHMLDQRWGRIINISSIVGLMGSAGQANYAAAKSAIIGFTKSIAREYAKRNITANVVCPGYIQTDMTEKLPSKIKETIINSIPVGRVGFPEDVANLVIFLASDLASYITGEVVNISGGLYM